MQEQQTLDLGNNEQVSRGVFPNEDGTFTAMTFTKSKTFKTPGGAQKWYARQTGGLTQIAGRVVRYGITGETPKKCPPDIITPFDEDQTV